MIYITGLIILAQFLPVIVMFVLFMQEKEPIGDE